MSKDLNNLELMKQESKTSRRHKVDESDKHMKKTVHNINISEASKSISRIHELLTKKTFAANAKALNINIRR
jgi:hypothetical protein